MKTEKCVIPLNRSMGSRLAECSWLLQDSKPPISLLLTTSDKTPCAKYLNKTLNRTLLTQSLNVFAKTL